MMRAVHDRARVHASMAIMAFAALGMLTNAIIGKRNARQGITLERQRQAFQEEYNKRKSVELEAQSAHK